MSADSGQLSPAAAARLKKLATVLCGIEQLRAICRFSSFDSNFNLRISLIFLMDSLLAGISAFLPVRRLLYQRLSSVASGSVGMNSGDVVHHSAMLSTVPVNHEKWTTSSGMPDNIDRNGWTTSIGISGQHAPENALITHVKPVAQAGQAYEQAFDDPSCLKMVLDWRKPE
jgi:hypothetical protein